MIPNRPLAVLPVLAALLLTISPPLAAQGESETPEPPPKKPVLATMADVLAATTAADWRPLDPERTVYLELPDGRVVIELATEFAPQHAANVLELGRGGYFDGARILRVQDNYVVQWGDPAAGDEEKAKPFGKAKGALEVELDRPSEGLDFTPLGDADVYAPEVGFSHGLPVGRDPDQGRAWLLHCYGMVGVGRGMGRDSGNGSQLYTVIGHAPRHLDRQVTVVGRVVHGIEHLTALPRGTGRLGFYEDPSAGLEIEALRPAAAIPEAERTHLELLRTDSPAFRALIETRRHRREEWFFHPVDAVEVCNVPLPVRGVESASTVELPGEDEAES